MMKKQLLLTLMIGCGVMVASKTPGAHARPSAKHVSVIKAILSTKDSVSGTGQTTFKQTDKVINCLVKLNCVAMVSASSVWIAVDAAGQHNAKFVEAKLPKQLADTLHFNATTPHVWPTGKYRADIYVNGKLVRSLPYSVVK